MSSYRFTKPYPFPRRIKLDNVALVPASLLPYKSQWQAIANGLSPNGVLIILPTSVHKLRRTMEAVANTMEAKGCRVTTIADKRFT